jgi:hypothetical protein
MRLSPLSDGISGKKPHITRRKWRIPLRKNHGDAAARTLNPHVMDGTGSVKFNADLNRSRGQGSRLRFGFGAHDCV